MNTPSKLKTAGVWLVSGLLAALFLLTGIPKLMGRGVASALPQVGLS